MDSGFPLDVADILENIGSAEVISIFFPLLHQVLLVDTRHDGVEGPMVRVAPMVDSLDERVRSLRRMRPRFGAPAEVRLAAWPGHVSGLEEHGVVDAIVHRLLMLGYANRLPDLRRAVKELQTIERNETIAAITGDNYESLWERRPQNKLPDRQAE